MDQRIKVDTDIVFRGIKSEADKKAEYLNACLNPVYLADFMVTYKVEKGDYIFNRAILYLK